MTRCVYTKLKGAEVSLYNLQDFNMVKIEFQTTNNTVGLPDLFWCFDTPFLGSENYSGKNPWVVGSSPTGATHFKFG